VVSHGVAAASAGNTTVLLCSLVAGAVLVCDIEYGEDDDGGFGIKDVECVGMGGRRIVRSKL
jgi:hypothetical protein